MALCVMRILPSVAYSPHSELIRLLTDDRDAFFRHALACSRVRPRFSMLEGGASLPSLRIYVATRKGVCALKDDRSCLPLGAKVSLIRAEYGANTDDDSYPPAFSNVEVVACPSECKGDMLYRLSLDSNERAPVDYTAFLDDDLLVSVTALYRAATEAHRLGIHAFQLALTDDSHAVWEFLKGPTSLSNPEEPWRSVPFVEIMAPVLSSRLLNAGILSVLSPFRSGFGWDFYLLSVLQLLHPDLRMGLYMRERMRHIRPVRTRVSTRFSNGLTAMEEEERLRAALLFLLLQGAPSELDPFLEELTTLLRQSPPALLSLGEGLQRSTRTYWELLDCRRALLELRKQHEQEHQELCRLRNAYGKEREQWLHEQDLLLQQHDRLLRSTWTWRLGSLISRPLGFFRRLGRWPARL